MRWTVEKFRLISAGHTHQPRKTGESAIIERAVSVIGDRGKALRWMGTPIPALNYATPISLLHSYIQGPQNR